MMDGVGDVERKLVMVKSKRGINPRKQWLLNWDMKVGSSYLVGVSVIVVTNTLRF